MAENPPENLPFPMSADPAGRPACFASESTRTDSDSSAITLDVSKDAWLSFDDAMQGKSTEWTDEKHSMYLDYLESSFVDELYHSIHMGSLGMKKNSRKIFSFDQFVVLGDGARERINYERNEPFFDSTADSNEVVESPFNHHSKYSGKDCSVACLDTQERLRLCNNGVHSKGETTCLYESSRSWEQGPVGRKCHQDLAGSTAEFSDQNFVEDNPGRKRIGKSMSKRLKTASSDCSSKDESTSPEQFHERGVSIRNSISSYREGRSALPSEQPEDLLCSKSDIHYFLRGS